MGAIIEDKIYELSNTTPDAQEVQMYLDMMVKAGCTHAVIEVSFTGNETTSSRRFYI